jgi:molybdate transport system substrate-binding protein
MTMQSTRFVRVLLAFWAVVALALAGCGAPAPVVSAPGSTVNSTASNVSVAPTASTQAASVKVFAPSSLIDAAKELAAAYEANHPGIKVAIEFGHTPTQRLQLTKGATGDVFISASQKDMNDAIADGSVGQRSSKGICHQPTGCCASG